MSKGPGRSGRPWLRLTAQLRAERPPICCRCGHWIDRTLPTGHPLSWSADHYPTPVSAAPHLALDPANLSPAHLRCNTSAGATGPTTHVPTSRAW